MSKLDQTCWNLIKLVKIGSNLSKLYQACAICHVRVLSGSCQGPVRVRSGSCQCYFSVISRLCQSSVREMIISKIIHQILRRLGDWKAFQSCFFKVQNNFNAPWLTIDLLCIIQSIVHWLIINQETLRLFWNFGLITIYVIDSQSISKSLSTNCV